MLLALNAASLDHNCSCDGDAVSVKKNASASIQPILRIEIRYSCNTLLPSILHSPTGICPSAAVIPLRCAPRSADFSIISRLSATSRKAEQEGATIIVRGEGVHDLGYCRICPSASFRHTGTFQSFPSSGVSAAFADPLGKYCLEESS